MFHGAQRTGGAAVAVKRTLVPADAVAPSRLHAATRGVSPTKAPRLQREAVLSGRRGISLVYDKRQNVSADGFLSYQRFPLPLPFTPALPDVAQRLPVETFVGVTHLLCLARELSAAGAASVLTRVVRRPRHGAQPLGCDSRNDDSTRSLGLQRDGAVL